MTILALSARGGANGLKCGLISEEVTSTPLPCSTKGQDLTPSWLLQADHAQPTVQGLGGASSSMAQLIRLLIIKCNRLVSRVMFLAWWGHTCTVVLDKN